MSRKVVHIRQTYPYKTLAVREETYWKVSKWADYLRKRNGRATIGDTIDFLVDSVRVPPEED